MGRSVDHRCGGAGSRSLRQRHPTRSRPVLSAEPRPRSPRSRFQHGRRAPRPEPRSARPGDLRVPEHPVHRLGPAHAGAVAAQGSDQGDAGVPWCSHGAVHLHRGARTDRAHGADLPRVRQAGRGGIGKGRVRQQLVRERRGAAGARPVPARALRRARAGRDVPPGPGVHRRDPRERPGGLLPAGDRIRFLGPARGRAAGVRLRGEVGVGPTRSAARDLPMPRTRAGGAVPRNRAHGARRLPRARMPRLVPGRPSGGPIRRAERPRAEPAAGHPSRSGHELLLPQGGARRRVRLRRADPGTGPHRLAPAGGTGADGRRGDPPRGTGPAAGGGGRVKVVILFDPGAEDWTPEDIRGVMKAVDEIGAIFASMGHEIRKVGVRHDMRWFQVARRADLVFNLCEGVHGKSEWEEHVVGTLEFAGIPITGASLWTLAACRRKPIANALLQQAGLPIPRWTVAQGKIEDDFPLPAIVKPAAEDASAGLDRGSVVSDRKSLRARLAAMTEQFDEVLVQEYIAGREFNVGIVGTRTLPIAEIDFSTMPEGTWPILTYAAKWHVGSLEDLGSRPVCPAQIPQRLADRLCRLAEAAWRTMQGKSYGRVDLRVDSGGRPWVLEVNPNPDLTDDAGLSRMAQAAGWEYPELVRRIAEVALRDAQGRRPRVSCSLRPVDRAHRGRVEALVRATGMFRPSEVETAVQVLDESLAGEDDYRRSEE